MGLEKFWGCGSAAHIAMLLLLECAADEAESISSLLMDGYSLHVYPYCAAPQPAAAICTEGTNWEFLGRFHLHKSACLPCTYSFVRQVNNAIT